MMKLLSAAPSPFGRKVKIAAHVKGVIDQIEIVTTDSSLPENPVLRSANPLAKIPVLILADGTQIFDSYVICDYIDQLRPSPELIPKSGEARYRTLTLAALADGIAEAALLIVYETRFRPADKHVPAWIDRQQAKINAAVAQLDANPPVMEAIPNYGDIAVAAALGYLDLRLEGRWRRTSPKLVAWLDHFAHVVPSFEATRAPS